MAANSRSAKYYQSHPEARRKKQAYDAKLNSKPGQVKKRMESNQKRAEGKRKGLNLRGRDWDHKTKKFISVRANRGRRGEGGR